MRSARILLSFVLLLGAAQRSSGEIIGTNSAAQPVTAARVAALPKSQQDAWKKFLAKSEKRSQADQKFFQKEMQSHNLTVAQSPPEIRGTRGILLNRPTSWYADAEAIRIADIIVSFQTPSGGWSKNLDLTQHQRAPGEHFAPGNLSRFASPADLDAPRDPHWNYVGTFDNGATTTQLRYLAKVVAANNTKAASPYRKTFLHGLDYIFASQYPNGGWPQVWPLQGGYHDAITFNDGAMTAILQLLSEVSAATEEFAFVPRKIRDQATASLERGVDCVLASQVVERGQRTGWCQQYDALSLQPTAARNYEMPSLSSGESAGVMLYLMRQSKPSSNIVAAVNAAAAWFERGAIHDKSYQRVGNDGRHLVAAPGHGPLWSRYYEIKTDRPIFGDRDKSIHDSVEEISRERRDGYAWFTDAPEEALKRYEQWGKTIR